MTIELALSVASVAFGVIGGVFAVGKIVGRQFERALDARFAALEQARTDGQKVWNERIQRLEARQEALDGDVRRILIELPREYVTRTDYVRRETIIEGKIDQLSLRIENWILRGKDAA